MGSRADWFHPHLSGKDAETKLKSTHKEGAFLVRPSKSNPGDFTLSVHRDGAVTHIKIQNTGDYYDLYGGKEFATLAELVSHYQTHKGELKEKSGRIIELNFAIRSEDPTNERWFHGQLSGSESAKMLEERGVDGSFLVRQSQSKLGDFVLSVQCNGRVTHIMIRCLNGHPKVYDIGGGDQFNSLAELVNYYKANPIVETTGNVVHLKQPFNATRVNVVALGARLNELELASKGAEAVKAGFAEEFEQLQQMELTHIYDRKEGQRPENKAKNRYKNILPFDHTRVRLRDLDGAGGVGADYINANYINGEVPGSERRYIGCQGCLAKTVGDFWQMLWEQNSRAIVMTTSLEERGRKKCEKYWPDSGQPLNVGRFCVIMSAPEIKKTSHVVRQFKLSMAGGREERNIVQYHFTAWPDHGVPQTPEAAINFLMDVKAKMHDMKREVPDLGPLTVHCSAGIGRTGTFIVIDILLDFLNQYGYDIDIDIQKTIHTVRHQRSGMIQTEAQYRFIYQAVNHYITAVEQRVKRDKLVDKAAGRV